MPYIGCVYFSDIVQKVLPELLKKAAKLVADKCSLAARVENEHRSPDGAYGHSVRADVERKLDILQDPTPVKQIKMFPVQIDGARKKRGSRRYRNWSVR